ncbi:serine/threonine protein kinase [Stigmatella aurantiaca]|uniref:Serine/threonine-protein kinase n=1 Tax=Stigmatella aurantiaca (strain DW4/3-1) TaxID=378806 RepID=Q08N95_STIAD|nr:serine/threonine-protein kinase [Stigmatella aurantiaca]ADO73320.1 Serine/threonine-protein kinase [Stigmatella aurantiaca DW4/3-1]EAU61954.1 serine/threonine-protein kinase Pkn6 [Stigmatella aurantiaca DW4/3-1]
MKRPTTFGKYLLLERINVGGMAEVFIAKAFGVEGFERFLAIKKILPTMAEDQEFITMFIDEARISVQLNHANVVHIHELGKYEDTYFIAMEYVAGRDLRTILERYRRRKEIMPTAQAVFIASKMCEGLDYAHRKKDARGQDLSIIHRDVSPQNILVSYEGEVKIIDFGIAKATNRSQKTQAGILKGKFGYMSPEQVRGMPIDRRSDVFAVGVILYEMLTGEKLFVGESDFSTLEKVRNADVPRPREFNPNCPAGLEKVVLKALAREPDERYLWASDLQEDLMRFLLAGDAIYSSKHLSGFMKEAFAEDMLREAEKMERFSAIERPDQIETSGVTAMPPQRAPRRTSLATPVPVASAPSRATPPPQRAPPPDYIPPPTEEELAEMDGAADKTQIVDSAMALQGEEPAAVLYDDSQTGKNANPLSSDDTGRSQNPLHGDDTGGRLENPFTNSDSTMAAPMPTSAVPMLRPKGKSGPKSQVVIGEGEPESFGGATMIGPAPTSRRNEAEEEQEEEKASTVALTGSEQDDALDEADGSMEEEGQETGEVPAAPARRLPPSQSGKPSGRSSKLLAKPLNPKILMGAGAGVAVLLLIGLLAVVFSGSDTGQIMFTVEPAERAQVLVDDQPVAVGTVLELEPGDHKVVARASGYQRKEMMVKILAGQKPLPVLLKLQREAEEKRPPAEIAQKPDPVPAPPPTVGDPPPSKPAVPQEPPKPPTFQVVFVGNKGAEIVVDGKSAGQTPNAKAADLVAGKTYKFVAKLAGYKPFTGEFKYEGQSEQQVSFALEQEPPKEPERVVATKAPEPKPEPKPKPPPPPKEPPKAKAIGKFACSTKPAGASIWVDGKDTGRVTPVAIGNPLLLPVGNRKIVFKLNGKQTKPKTVLITEAEVAKLIGEPIE